MLLEDDHGSIMWLITIPLAFGLHDRITNSSTFFFIVNISGAHESANTLFAMQLGALQSIGLVDSFRTAPRTAWADGLIHRANSHRPRRDHSECARQLCSMPIHDLRDSCGAFAEGKRMESQQHDSRDQFPLAKDQFSEILVGCD